MIKYKREVSNFIKNFEVFSRFDGEKYYFVFETKAPKGTVTLMKYDEGNFTLHRKNEVFWDIGEVEINGEKLKEFIWENRKSINANLKITVR